MTADYTPEQLGEIRVWPIEGRTKSQFTLVVVQPASNVHVTILEPCSWGSGRRRTLEMVKAGVDPFDIYFSYRQREVLDTDGLPLQHCGRALWWTAKDQHSLDQELVIPPRRHQWLWMGAGHWQAPDFNAT